MGKNICFIILGEQCSAISTFVRERLLVDRTVANWIVKSRIVKTPAILAFEWIKDIVTESVSTHEYSPSAAKTMSTINRPEV